MIQKNALNQLKKSLKTNKKLIDESNGTTAAYEIVNNLFPGTRNYLANTRKTLSTSIEAMIKQAKKIEPNKRNRLANNMKSDNKSQFLLKA